MTRLARLLAITFVMMFGAAGAATAQTTTYNFAFTSASGNGGGLITADATTRVVQSISNFFIGGSPYSLDTTGNNSFAGGSSPTLNSFTTPPYFGGNFAQGLFVSNGTNGFFFIPTSPTQDSIFSFTYGGGTYGFTGTGNPLTTETLSAVPVPLPGGGLLSWIAAAMMLAGAGAWRQFKTRQGLAPA